MCLIVYGLYDAYDYHGLARQASRFVCQCQCLRCMSYLIVDTYSQSVGIDTYFRPNCVDGNQSKATEAVPEFAPKRVPMHNLIRIKE